MLLVRSQVPDYSELLGRLAVPGDAAPDCLPADLDGTTPERRLTALLLQLRSEQHAAVECEAEPAERLVELERELARAHRTYMSNAYLTGCASPTRGTLCAVQVDGALETRRLGYSAATARGALAVRALVCHGFRVVLVTADPFDDLVGLCDAYRVYGGLAEHGAVAYDHTTGETAALVSESERADLEILRATLLYVPGAHVDRGSRIGVRAYRAEGDGALEPALAAWAVAEADVEGRVQARHSSRCMDFTAVGVDMTAGLAEISVWLGAAGPERLATEVAALIGHRPGRCPRCRPPKQRAEARAFQQALADVALPTQQAA